MKKDENKESKNKMGRSDPSQNGRDQRTCLKAHFDEENLAKTARTVRRDKRREIAAEPKTPFPRNVPPVDPEELRTRLNRAAEQSNNEIPDDNVNRDENRSERNVGGRSEFCTSNSSTSDNPHENETVNDQLSIEGNSGVSMEIQNRSISTAQHQPGVSSGGTADNSNDQDVFVCQSDSFEERRRRFQAQEFKIAKELLENVHEIEEH